MKVLSGGFAQKFKVSVSRRIALICSLNCWPCGGFWGVFEAANLLASVSASARSGPLASGLLKIDFFKHRVLLPPGSLQDAAAILHHRGMSTEITGRLFRT